MTTTTLVSTPSGRVRVHLRGPLHAPPLFFVHGALVSANLWEPLIDRLSERYRCIAPELPLGSHAVPLEPHADCSPPGVADLCVELLEALSLPSVTLVGNDSGGAISQLVAARHPDRVERLVLTNCDAFEVMPPAGYEYMRLFRFPGLARLGARAIARMPSLGQLPYTWGPLAARMTDDLIRGWVEPMARVDGIARDFAKFAAEVHPRHTLAAAAGLRTFAKPVRVIWGSADRFFTLGLAQRIVDNVTDGVLFPIEGGLTYVMLDAPDAVAEVIEREVPTDASEPLATANGAY